VAKHKSGVISDGTTFSHNIKEDSNEISTNGVTPTLDHSVSEDVNIQIQWKVQDRGALIHKENSPAK
jgi:hypothetical protein